MINYLFSKFDFLEVVIRCFFAKFPSLKKRVKGKRKAQIIKEKKAYDSNAWNEYKTLVNSSVEDNSIVIIHASMDGLNNIGVDERKVFDLLLSLVDRGCTVVSTAYPITNLKIIDNKMKIYNPEKTPCWTGMLSNIFVSSPLSVRSAVPYNSLAAIGPLSEEMMSNNLLSDSVYGDNTPWKYCVDHHARILFIGTTCLESNTIQTHMLPDYMGDEWPIENWYDEIETPIRINGEIINKKLKIQSNFWTKYAAEYSNTEKVRSIGLLKEFEIKGCPFGYITDAYLLVKYLEERCKQGKLMYIIPRKYWKKGWRKNGNRRKN